MQDETHWLPEPQNFPLQFKMPEGLKTLLDILYFGSNQKRVLNPRTPQLKFSLAQDLVYTATEERVKTPKSICFHVR